MKKETLKDWVKGWSIKQIVRQASITGMEFMANKISDIDLRKKLLILSAELNRRIRNAKKL